MLKATLAHRVVVSCPVCRAESYRRLGRSTGAAGSVSVRCVCSRCAAQFTYEEDRSGKPLRR